jgi:hypothetical protein
MDRGSFSSLSGDQLTITEGTKSATYKTVTLTIPSGATVRRNEAQAQLSDLKAGDEVNVLQGPKSTVVIANDAQHQLTLKPPVIRHGDAPRIAPGAPAVPEEGASIGPPAEVPSPPSS